MVNRNLDEYQPKKFYEQNTKARQNGFAKVETDGAYYFALYQDGDIVLLSPAYKSIAERDAAIDCVKKNRRISKRYRFDERAGKKHGFGLYAGNGQEIAISADLESLAEAEHVAGQINGSVKTFEASAKAPIAKGATKNISRPKPKPKAVEPKVTPLTKPVVTSPSMEKLALPETTSAGGRFLKWCIAPLLALLVFLLFKSCKPTQSAPIVKPVVACWDGSNAANKNACPVKVTCWDGSYVKNMASCPAEPPKTYRCWDGSEVQALSFCPAEPASEPEQLVKPDPEPAPAPAPEPAPIPAQIPVTTNAPSLSGNISRLCGPSSNILFNVPNSSPKTLELLGSDPQYGNSHGVSAEQFHAKLVAAHRTGGMDQAFLNLMARSLGYSHFQDMSVSDFSESTLPNGVKGLLGFGASHVLQYSKIQTSDPQHLEAFRVRGLNGTDVHIMKSSGSYMYVCN